MPIQVIAPVRDQRLQQQLALSQILGQLGSGLRGFEQQQQQDTERAALVELLGGMAGQGPVPLNPGASGQQNALMAALGDLSGQPEAQGPPTAPTAGLLPGMTPEQARAYVSAGAGGELLKVGLDRAYPAPVDPVDQARLDIQRQGMALDQQGLQLRREMFTSDQEFQRAKLALEERGLAQSAAAASMPEPPKFSDIRNMRLDYRDNSTPFMDLAANYEKLGSALASETGEGDIAAIFSFMKSLDPTSTVREGEAASAQNSSGALQGLWNTYNQVLSGERLAPQQRQNFLAVSGNWLSQARDRQLTFEQQHRFQAEQAGIDPARTVPDVIGKYREWSPVEPGGRTPMQSAGQGVVDTVLGYGRDLLGMGPGAQASPPAAGTSGPDRAQQQTTAAPPQVGDIEDGYRFRGGDWRDPNAWERVQ